MRNMKETGDRIRQLRIITLNRLISEFTYQQNTSYNRNVVVKHRQNTTESQTRGVKHIWNDIKKLINRELLSIGVGTRQLNDYRTAISSIVRRTYGYKSITDIQSDNEEVELFVLEIINSIKERRGKEWRNATTG